MQNPTILLIVAVVFGFFAFLINPESHFLKRLLAFLAVTTAFLSISQYITDFRIFPFPDAKNENGVYSQTSSNSQVAPWFSSLTENGSSSASEFNRFTTGLFELLK